jgi:hypothetical protein
MVPPPLTRTHSSRRSFRIFGGRVARFNDEILLGTRPWSPSPPNSGEFGAEKLIMAFQQDALASCSNSFSSPRTFP